MSGAGLIRTVRGKMPKAGDSHPEHVIVIEEEKYLNSFPKASDIVKDLHLHVLFGRQVMKTNKICHHLF
jgi:hypothetical protein